MALGRGMIALTFADDCCHSTNDGSTGYKAGDLPGAGLPPKDLQALASAMPSR